MKGGFIMNTTTYMKGGFIVNTTTLTGRVDSSSTLRLLHEGWIHREHYDSYMKGGFIVNTTTLT